MTAIHSTGSARESLFFVFQANAPLLGPPADAVERQIRALVRGDIAAIVLGTVICVAGLSALAVHVFRHRSRDKSLLSFGLFSCLYGARLLAHTATIRLLFDAPPLLWPYVEACINYAILIPSVLFFESLYGKGWRSSVRWLLWIQTVYAVVAVAVDVALKNPFLAPDPALILTGPLVVLILVLGKEFGYTHPKIVGSRVLQAGSLVFVLFVFQAHLVGTRLVPWRTNLEPVGFFLFICCLGYISALRFFTNEQQLVAIEKEMESARHIQASILPRQMPRVAGLDVAARYVPVASVAGDFYDFLVVDGERLGIFVADVSGHGVPAALIASMVKVAVSSQASSASDPAQLLSGLNHIFCRQLQGQFITAGYLFLDVGERRAIYSGAGHPPLLLWRRTAGTLDELSENGLLFGFRPDAKYSNAELALEPGDRILLYTDGIIEAANNAEECFGDRQLKQSIRAHQHLPAGEFADALLDELAAWTGRGHGSAHEDDLTLIVVDVRS